MGDLSLWCVKSIISQTSCVQNTGNVPKAVVNIPSEPYYREATYDDIKRRRFWLRRIIDTESS